MTDTTFTANSTKIPAAWLNPVNTNTYSRADKAALVLLTPALGLKVFVSSSDGGLFKAVVGAAAGTYSDNGGSYCGTITIPTGGDGSIAWVRADGGYNVGLPYNAQWWGVSVSSSNNSPMIQAALDYLDSLLPLAQTLQMRSGKYLVTDEIEVNSQGITWQGEGGNYFFQNSDQRNGTILKWNGGAGTVLRVTPNLTTRPIIAPTLKRISIDGQSLASTGLRIESCTQGVFEDIYIAHCIGRALHTGSTTLAGYAGLYHTHSCTFRNIGIDQVFATDGDGLVLDGDNSTGGTTTVCGFYEIHIRHYDGDGLVIARGDNNMFYKASVGRPPAGSGRGIVFDSVPNSPSVNTNCMFYGLGGEGGVYSMADDTINAIGNAIYGLSIDTDNPRPVIESGSTFYYHQLFDAVDSNNTFGENRMKLIGDHATAMEILGTRTYGIDFQGGTYSLAQIRLNNNEPINARNNADSADVEVLRISTGDELVPGVSMRLAAGDNLNFATAGAGSNVGGSATQKFAFWGVTPIVQPSANADTTGATLLQLETEVNELKQLLRDTGLMA